MRSRLTATIRRILASRALALSAGLVLLSLCLVSLADLVGLRPNGSEARQEARESMAETLSVRLSLLAGSAGPATLEAAIGRFVSDTPSVVAAELRRVKGGASTTFGSQGLSIAAKDTDWPRALIPIFDGDEPWGELDVAFRPVDALREDALYFGALALALLLTYLAYLGKALVQLDPRRAIPERVDSAFNMLVEGVVVLDERLRVLMVNEAAAEIVGRPAGKLIGGNIERWPWLREEGWQSPWTTVLKTGMSIVDHPVTLRRSDTNRAAPRPANYTLNCSLIRNDAGRPTA